MTSIDSPPSASSIGPPSPPMPPEKRGRLSNLDALRGVCALLVVIQHSMPSFAVLGDRLWAGHPQFYLDFGRIGVGAFFLISGYVIPFSAKTGPQAVRRFWTGRFWRLWPAYWVSIVLAVAIGEAGESHLTPHLLVMVFARKQVLVNLTMLQQFVGVPNVLGVFWTLQIELIFYAAVTGLLMAGRLHDRRIIMLCYAAAWTLALAMALGRWYTGHKLPAAIPIGLAMMFLATHLRMRRLSGVAGGFDPWMAASFFALLAPVCLIGYSGRVDAGDDPYRWLLAYSLALLVFLGFERAQDAPRILVLLGAISYSLYLLGDIAVTLAERMLPTRPWVALPVALALAIAMAALSFVLVERPSHELGKRLSRRMPPAAPARGEPG